MKKTVATILLIIGLAARAVDGNAGGLPALADNPPGQPPQGLSPESLQEKAAWAEQQKAIDQAKADAEPAIDYLQTDAAAKLQDANVAQVEVESLRKELLYAKNLDARDPWREIHGVKKYAMSLGSDVVQFRGQVQEATTNGIRVLGQIGDATGVEYFVTNFPYLLEAGESFDPTKIFVAFEDGTFTYETDEGYSKTIPKLNYGKPCVRPPNADAVELAAQKLTPQEAAQIKSAQNDAKEKMELAGAAQKRLQERLDQVDASWKAGTEKLRLDQEKALQLTEEQAGKGDATALRRMGERYRDGDGVAKNLVKAAGYFKQAEAAIKAQDHATTSNSP